MEEIGLQQQNTVVLLMARLYQAIARWSLGEFAAAWDLLKECLQLKDPAYRAASAALTPEDPYLMTLSWVALSLASLGYIEQARAHISEALSVVAGLEKTERQAYSHGFVLVFACGTEWHAGSTDGVKRHSDKLVALADEYGFPYLWTMGLCYNGWAATALGDPSKGLDLLSKGPSTNRVIGSVYGTAWYFNWQADAHNQLGRSDLALDLLLKAEAVIEENGERFMEAELHLVWGALEIGRGEALAAEKHFREALELSRRRSARIYELNAAIRLARLLKETGERKLASFWLPSTIGSPRASMRRFCKRQRHCFMSSRNEYGAALATIRASWVRLAVFSLRSTAGSQRASTRAI
jgi:tetratricopeptide (TPR) repeat protein